MVDIGTQSLTRDLSRTEFSSPSDTRLFRAVAVAAGLTWSVLFIVVGLRFDLQMFGDGSIFSYSIAVADSWNFHWHNISGRLFVHLFTHVPAEAYVRLTGDARGSILAYGLLFFGAQLAGLLLTRAVDRSRERIIFTYACCSTACLCPLVYGAPTEMWMAHALFWPALAVCHYASGPRAGLAIFAVLLALVLTHEGALVFALAILATLLLRGMRDPAFLRSLRAFALVLPVWALVKIALPPDDYFAGVLATAALNIIDLSNLTVDPFRVLACALVGYALACLILSRIAPAQAHVYAGMVVVAALAVYWSVAASDVNGDNKYYFRTALLLFTPAFGAIAAAYALAAEGRLRLPVPYLPSVLKTLANGIVPRAAAGAILIATLIHAVEVGRFVVDWRSYEAAVRTLATGTASDPQLGDPRFVSANRIPVHLTMVEWPSTTHFLSVLAAPGFAPRRLVVHADANYFWFTCQTALESRDGDRAIPRASRELVRKHTCLHR
jgi:hypothetical protein